jgi:nucleoside-diphosphate-sugar epimerase
VEYVRLRRDAEDILQSVGAAVVNLPDFFGPQVHTGTLQQALADATCGKTMSWIGGRDTPREYVFVPDAMRTVAVLAAHSDAYGERWIIPGAGPLTARQVASIVSDHLGHPVKLRCAGVWALRLAALFMKELKQFLPMVPYYAKPIAYDGSKLGRLLGEQETTPYSEGIGVTLDWLRASHT